MATLTDIVRRITTGNDGVFRVEMMGDGAFIQYRRHIPCEETRETMWHGGRKWYISPFMTEDEIFRTCLLAVRTFEEHEVLERFRVDGKRYLDPHPEGARVEGKRTWETLY